MHEYEDNQEFRRLHDFYQTKSDEELIELHVDFDGLTEVAKDALKDELRSRNLWDANPPAEPDSDPKSADDDERLIAPTPGVYMPVQDDIGVKFNDGTGDFEIGFGGVGICQCANDYEADLCGYVLDLADIKYRIVRGSGQLDMRLPQIWVAPDDEERAKALLSRPPSDSILRDFEARHASENQDFVEPKCEHCGSTEVMLESVEPTNRWRCDACGATWQDPPPEN